MIGNLKNVLQLVQDICWYQGSDPIAPGQAPGSGISAHHVTQFTRTAEFWGRVKLYVNYLFSFDRANIMYNT